VSRLRIKKGQKHKQIARSDATLATDEMWARALDMTGFDQLSAEVQARNVAAFLSLFEIPTEGEDDFCFMDMTGSYEFQYDNLVTTFEEWKTGHRAEFRNPKSRRRGCSQGWRAFFFERIVRVPGWRGAIVAQTDPDSMVHLQALHEMAAQLPKSALAASGVNQSRSGARELAFRHGRFKTSSVVVKTASARGLGRGGQLNGVLQTERPHWATRSKRDRSAFLGSCRMRGGNIVIDESTANQYDEFYDDTMASLRGENAAHLIFLPSHEHGLNRLPFRNDGERKKLETTLGEVKRFGERNELEAYDKRLRWCMESMGYDDADAKLNALEFCSWRRDKIANDCGSLRVFWREEPTTLEEAFSGAARTVLPLDVMDSWVPHAKALSKRGTSGKLVDVFREGRLRQDFVTDRGGELTIFEMPKAGGVYCFGCDVASGFEIQASSGAEADYSVANFKEVYSGRTVAQIRGHVFPKPFGRLLLECAVFFNVARGYVENNLDTVVAILLEDDDLEVMGTIGPDILMTSERKVRVVGQGMTVQPQYGFKTTEKSKEYLVARHERFMLEWGEVDADTEKGSPTDWLTLSEMRRVVRMSTAGERARGAKTKTRIAAESGHDDCWIAEALAIVARDELLSSGQVPLYSAVQTIALPEDAASRRWALESMRDGGKGGTDSVLGEAF